MKKLKQKIDLQPEEIKELERKWEEATLANNFIFYKVMRHHPNALKHLIEILLKIKVRKLKYTNEETINIDAGAKGIRLDVYAYDSERVFDLEIQTTNTKELPERARFYQGVMDIDTLKSGQFFSALKESHVIFICFEDIFGKGLPVYTFKNICEQDGKTPLGDRTYKYFFNARKCAIMTELDSEQRDFFNFLCSGKSNGTFAAELGSYVKDAKHNTQWRMQFMWLDRELAYRYSAGIEEGERRGIQVGILEGSRQKAEETAKNFLKMGLPIEQIAKGTGLSIEEIQKLK